MIVHACNVPGESQSKQPSWSFKTICKWHNTKARAWSRSDVLLHCWLCWGLVRAGSKNGLKKWYLQAHLSILEYTCICILEQGSLWTRIAYVFFRRGRAWYPFSHGHDIIGKLQRRVWRTQNHCAKLSDPTFTWNEDLGMRLNSTKCCLIFYSNSTHLIHNDLRHCV